MGLLLESVDDGEEDECLFSVRSGRLLWYVCIWMAPVHGMSGAGLVGLRYRRRAGVGVSSVGAGRFSSVNWGVIDKMLRVR